MTISEVAKKYSISDDTLRYYEKIGLLRDIPRTSAGLRDYDEQACRSVEFIKCMRGAGVSIETLLSYIDLCCQGDSTVEQRKNLLIEQREQLKLRLLDLQSALERLDYKIDNYENIMKPAEEIYKK